ncbi:MAG: hypothetical protein VYB65_04165 [Myxococcota bacterium]|nr:hypothetical protein [Myxococcota bacterium]
MKPRHLLLSLLVLTVMACGGGGGCGGCACLEPLEGGFPVDELANSAGQVRLTGAGLDFIESNINPILGSFVGMTCPDGETPCPRDASCSDGRCVRNGEPISTIGFRVPPTNSSGARICQGAGRRDCNVYIDMRNVEMNPVEPDRINVEARMDISSDPIKVRWSFIRCDMTVRANNKRVGVPLTLRADNPLRRMAIEVGDPEFSIDSNDVRLCGGLNWLRGVIIGLLRGTINDSLSDAIRDAVDENLFQNCDNGCPDNTECSEGYCRFPGGAKVPIALGVEGRLDLSQALEGQGPDGLLAGEVDIGLVAGGTTGTRGGGVEVGLMGGARAEEPSACVPALETAIPEISPVQFNDSADRRCEGRDNECGDGNTCSEGYCLDGEGNRVQIPFHVGFGLAQQYMEQALLGFHQGGALCIKVGAELSELISSGTLSLLMPSINELIAGHQPSPAPMRLSLVPRAVPSLEIGAGRYEIQDGERVMVEPLMHIKVDDLAINFELMIQERFVQVATILADLRVGLGLTLDGDNNLVLAMSDPGSWIAGVEVQDAKILLESEEEIAEAIPALLELALPLLLGNLDSAFALPELGIFNLAVDSIGGIRPRPEPGEDGLDRFDFLGLFASLGINNGQPNTLEVGTRAELVEVVDGHTEAYRVTHPGAVYVPEVKVKLGLTGAGRTGYEVSWRVDDGLWRTAQPADDGQVVSLRSHVLSLQGHHRIELRGRVAGNPATTDRTPAVLDVVIDTEPPNLSVQRSGELLTVSAWDRVWSADQLRIELSADGEVIAEGFGALEAPWPADAARVTLRAEDGSGRVARQILAFDQIDSLEPADLAGGDMALIDAGQGCGCGATDLSALLWLVPLLALRRRRKVVA